MKMENLNEKSREELIKEIENLNDEIKKRDKYSQYDTMGEELAATRDAMIAHGFTREEAFQIMLTAISNAFNK